MRGSTPKTSKTPKKNEKRLKIIQNYLYISIFLWIDPRLALVSSRRDLDASKRASEDPNPKKRTLGLAPSIFFKVDVDACIKTKTDVLFVIWLECIAACVRPFRNVCVCVANLYMISRSVQRSVSLSMRTSISVSAPVFI